MAKYKIITLYLSGNGKRVLKAGEVVSEKELVKQNIAKLLKSKQIKLVSGKDESGTAAAKKVAESLAKSETATKERAANKEAAAKEKADKAEKAKEAADKLAEEKAAKAEADAEEAAKAAEKDTDTKK